MYFADRRMTLGIEKVRFLPNGRIDFLSVNESARLNANMTIQWENERFMEMIENHKSEGESNVSAPEGNNDSSDD